MFLRTVKVKRDDGHVDEYVRLVESVWRNGRPEHRVISNLGRKDLLAPHAEALLRLLTGKGIRPTTQAEAVGRGTGGRCWSLDISGANWVSSRRWMREPAIMGRWPIARGRGWRVAWTPRRASMGWRGGWKRRMSAIDRAGGGCLLGVTRPPAARVHARACASRTGSCASGTTRWTGW